MKQRKNRDFERLRERQTPKLGKKKSQTIPKRKEVVGCSFDWEIYNIIVEAFSACQV